MGIHRDISTEYENGCVRRYLAFLRRCQPLDELRRKAKKAGRKGSTTTQEEEDLQIATFARCINNLSI